MYYCVCFHSMHSIIYDAIVCMWIPQVLFLQWQSTMPEEWASVQNTLAAMTIFMNTVGIYQKSIRHNSIVITYWKNISDESPKNWQSKWYKMVQSRIKSSYSRNHTVYRGYPAKRALPAMESMADRALLQGHPPYMMFIMGQVCHHNGTQGTYLYNHIVLPI